MINVIIVENEPKHSNNLLELLAKCEREISVKAVCTNVAEAYKKINILNPDLVFLDIDLDFGETGFDLLKLFKDPGFSVIFTTQYNTYNNAVSALRVCALDFLAKPVFHHELNEALSRYDKEQGILQIKGLKKNIESPDGNIEVVIIKTIIDNLIETIKIDVNQIMYCKSSDDATIFHLNEAVEQKYSYVSSIGIGEWEKILKESAIVRCHNQYLVNIIYVVRYIANGDGAILFLKNNTDLPVSRTRKKEIKKCLSH